MQAEQEALDQRILGIVSSLCQQLGVASYNPTIISWVSLIPRGKGMVEMPFDEVLVSKYEITLPAAMRTKLEPDEWKPIVASALIMSKKLRKKIMARMLIGAAILIAISAALFLTLPILLPSPVTTCKNGYCSTSPVGYMIAFFIGLPLPFIGTPILALAFGRRLKFVADRMAGELVGTAYFLGVLNKIASIAQGQATARKRMGGPLSPFPSLGSRIANLQNYSGPN